MGLYISVVSLGNFSFYILQKRKYSVVNFDDFRERFSRNGSSSLVIIQLMATSCMSCHVKTEIQTVLKQKRHFSCCGCKSNFSICAALHSYTNYIVVAYRFHFCPPLSKMKEFTLLCKSKLEINIQYDRKFSISSSKSVSLDRSCYFLK